MATATRWLALLSVAGSCGVAGCGPEHAAAPPAVTATDAVFRSEPCNGVTDADVTKVIGSTLFTKVVDTDVGCFWQENTVIGTFGIGMGISTWWYRGSDLDTERTLEHNAGRTMTELSVDGNKGFKASDDNACSIYVTKGGDVVTWSVQTLNPSMLPDLCSITDQLAKLSQERVN